jgi:hypothetical protein
MAEDAGFHVGHQRLHEELRVVQLYTFCNSLVHGLRYTCGVMKKKNHASHTLECSMQEYQVVLPKSKRTLHSCYYALSHSCTTCYPGFLDRFQDSREFIYVHVLKKTWFGGFLP